MLARVHTSKNHVGTCIRNESLDLGTGSARLLQAASWLPFENLLPENPKLIIAEMQLIPNKDPAVSIGFAQPIVITTKKTRISLALYFERIGWQKQAYSYRSVRAGPWRVRREAVPNLVSTPKSLNISLVLKENKLKIPVPLRLAILI